MFTLYQMAQPGEADMIPVNDVAFMTTYWAQAKLMYQKIGATGQPALVNLEPDFWGFLQGRLQAAIRRRCRRASAWSRNAPASRIPPSASLGAC